MVVAEFFDGQGLGNQLWIYASLRSLADKLGTSYSVLNPQCFKGSGFLQIDFGENISWDKKFNEPNSYLQGEVNTIYSEKQIFWGRHGVDVTGFDSGFYEIQDNTKINGYFQNEEYLKYLKSGLEQIFQYKKFPELRFLSYDDCCILNIRGGEYKANKRLALHLKYWTNAVDVMKSRYGIKKFFIVTDDYDYSHELFPRFEILDQSVDRDFYSLSICSNAILSNSSFSYFPLRLNSNIKTVLAPKFWAAHNYSEGFWACENNIYSGLNYLDRSGVVSTADQCKSELKKYKSEYPHLFSRVKPSRGFLKRLEYSLMIKMPVYK